MENCYRYANPDKVAELKKKIGGKIENQSKSAAETYHAHTEKFAAYLLEVYVNDMRKCVKFGSEKSSMALWKSLSFIPNMQSKTI